MYSEQEKIVTRSQMRKAEQKELNKQTDRYTQHGDNIQSLISYKVVFY